MSNQVSYLLVSMSIILTSAANTAHAQSIDQPFFNDDLTVRAGFTASQTFTIPVAPAGFPNTFYLDSVRVGTGGITFGTVNTELFSLDTNSFVDSVVSADNAPDSTTFFNFSPLRIVTVGERYELRMTNQNFPWDIQVNDITKPGAGSSYIGGLYTDPIFGPMEGVDARFHVKFAQRTQPVIIEINTTLSAEIDAPKMALDAFDTLDNLVDVLGISNPVLGAPLLNRSDTTVVLEQDTYFLFSEPLVGGGTHMEVAAHFPDGEIWRSLFQIGSLDQAEPWLLVDGHPGLGLSSTGITDDDRIGSRSLGPNGTFDVVLELKLTMVPEPGTVGLSLITMLALGGRPRRQQKWVRGGTRSTID